MGVGLERRAAERPWVAQCERGVVGSGRSVGRRGRHVRGAVRGVRAAVQQRVEPAPARAADPRGAAGGVRHLRPQLQDAAVPAPPHAGAASRALAQAAAAAAARAAARSALPTVVSPAPPLTRSLLHSRGSPIGLPTSPPIILS